MNEQHPDPIEHNRQAWDELVRNGNEWTLPASPEEIERARQGIVEIVLTPIKKVPADWFGNLPGKEVLCLAGGGGQQAPVLAAAGAHVTTLDNSPAQLEQDQVVARREGLEIKSVHGVMTDLSAFGDSCFDLIVNPCSNCFSPEILPMWQECFRVLKSGGELITGFSNPVRYLFDLEEAEQGNLVVKNRIPHSDIEVFSEELKERFRREGEPFEYGHTLNDQIGGQLAAGFVITGFYEDGWSKEIEPIAEFIDPFIATRARKP